MKDISIFFQPGWVPENRINENPLGNTLAQKMQYHDHNGFPELKGV